MSEDILKKLNERRAIVGVIGLGYVGLPLAVEFARAGLKVIGFDLDASRVDEINNGRSYIPDVPTEMVGALVERGNLSAATDFSHLSETDAVIICVPTPLNKNREPDISFILETGRTIAPHLTKGTLVHNLPGHDG